MCGIVGLHLRTPELYSHLGTLLSGMLCEMGDRGSDSAGVAVYGDPAWAPPGQGCVSVADLGTGRAEDVELVRRTVATALDEDVDGVDVVAVGDSHLLSCDTSSEALLSAVRACYPQAIIAGFGSDMAVLKVSATPRAHRAVGTGRGAGLAGRRPHPHGDRVRGHSVGLPSLRRRTGTVHGPQRVVRQPRHHPP